MVDPMDKILQPLKVHPGIKAKLAVRDPGDTLGIKGKTAAQTRTDRIISELPALQRRLYAEGRQALLILLQGMDASGKDGTIRNVMSVLNPQGCHVMSFKPPTTEEQSHDFLWRVHRGVPAKGEIGIFNRSHYEDVLIVRVRGLVPKAVWSKRFRQINDFERLLSESGVRILKFFLHLSPEEQKVRLQERLDDPEKQWKVDPADAKEREYWKPYQAAYEAALTECSTPWAPWYVIPSDRKWIRNLTVASLIRKTLEEMDPRYPKAAHDLSSIRIP